jgi:hypothetical protein
VALSLPAHERWTEQIEVGETTSITRDVALRPAPAIGVSASADLGARPPADRPAALAAPAPAPPRGADRFAPAWIAGGAAVVLAAVGAVYGASARADARALGRLAAPDGATATARARSARANARTANVLYGLSAGAAGLSAMFLVVEF